jgi:hypothetical protein
MTYRSRGRRLLDQFCGFLAAIGEAFISVWLIVAIGAGIGVALLYFAHDKHLDVKLFLDHLGIAFIVSSIAVFGYEARAHKVKTEALVKRLHALILEQREPALISALTEMFAEKDGRLSKIATEVSGQCQKLVDALFKLLQPADDARSRINEQYASFVSGLLEKLNKNAEMLVQIHAAKGGDFEVTKTAEYADAILAAEMNALQKGDKYEVLSNLRSWDNHQLQKFTDATELAVKRGVVVHRIFNIFSDTNDLGLDIGAVREVLEEHLKYVQTWKKRHGGEYSVRVFGHHERNSRLVKNSGAEYEHQHFGIFHLGESEVFCFDVLKPDLSSMRIEGKPEKVRDKQELFTELWNDHTSPLDWPSVARVISEKQEDAKRRAEQTRAGRLADIENSVGDVLSRRVKEQMGDKGEVEIVYCRNTEPQNAFLYEDTIRLATSEVRIAERSVFLPFVLTTLADTLLAAEMRQLRVGGHYDAITDLSSWQGDGLKRLYDETKSAVENGAQVRRIFHIFGKERFYLSAEETRSILEQHKANSRDWSMGHARHGGSYDVKFVGRDEKARAIENAPELLAMFPLEDFGIFRKINGGFPELRFKVPPHDLNKVSVTKEHFLMRGYESFFERLWEAAREFNDDEIMKIAREVRESGADELSGASVSGSQPGDLTRAGAAVNKVPLRPTRPAPHDGL